MEGKNAAASSRIHEEVGKITNSVNIATTRNMPNGGAIHIEDIQDQVELALMRAGHQKVARAYVLYREQRATERKQSASAEQNNEAQEKQTKLQITLKNGETTELDEDRLITIIKGGLRGPK